MRYDKMAANDMRKEVNLIVRGMEKAGKEEKVKSGSESAIFVGLDPKSLKSPRVHLDI